MKKLSLILITLFISIGVSSVSFAASNITEKSITNLIVNGKAAVIKDKPVLIDQKLYLSLKTLAVNIGIKDDKKSIIINNFQKTYTLIQGKNKLVLKLNSKKALMNSKTINLDNEPILYKNIPYLPAVTVTKLFGKNVIWNSETNTIAICDANSFKIVKDIMDKSNKAMNSTKYKGILTMDFSLGNIVKTNMQKNIESDGPGMIEHDTTITNNNGTKEYEEEYITDKFKYTKIGLDGIWTKIAAQKESTGVLDVGAGNDTLIYAGLSINNIASSNDIVLEGDIELSALFDDVKNDNTYKAHTKITINKNTYFVKEIRWASSGATTINNSKFKYSNITKANFSDFNTNSKVNLPDELSNLTETTQYENKSLSVKLNYPSTWEAMENVSGVNAAFLSPLESSTDKYRENVTLSVQDLSSQPMTLEQYTDLSLEQLKQLLTDYNLISSEESTFGGLKAHKIVYTFKQGEFNIKSMQIWAVKDNIAYLLSFVSETDKYNSFINLAEDVVKSFNIE